MIATGDKCIPHFFYIIGSVAQIVLSQSCYKIRAQRAQLQMKSGNILFVADRHAFRVVNVELTPPKGGGRFKFGQQPL